MASFGEFRRHWRPLLACFIGMGSALSVNSYILSTFAPYLIEEFGWSRSQWALAGIVQMLLMVSLPLAGRLTDIYGPRRVAAVGALSFPLFLVAIAMMNGDIRVYLGIYIAQTIICSTTTSTVYSRVVAEVFKIRRGLALAIAGMSPPLIGALGAPLMTSFVQGHGWRSGYLAVAAFSAVCAVITLALLPKGRPGATAQNPASAAGPSFGGAFRVISRTPAFWVMIVATLLINLPFALAASQLKLVILDQGISDSNAALLISAFALGSVLGRIISGTALDILPAHAIATINFGLPAIGLLLLASSHDSLPVVGLAIILIGVSFGGEGDILPYLVTRHFEISVFSTVLGLLTSATGISVAMGNAILGLTLAATNSFHTYLLTAAACSFIGSLGFLMLGRPAFCRPVGA